MAISYQILGAAGADNALLVRVDSGQGVERLLFDCGEHCLDGLASGDLLGIDHLCFSHFHLDHVCGFDGYFRTVFDRTDRPNRIWGPPDSARILQHRFQSYGWNLHVEMRGSWQVHEIHETEGMAQGEVRSTRFELQEAFAIAHAEGASPWRDVVWEGASYTLHALTLDHHTPSIAYVVREKPRRNIDPARIAQLGLRPGPWLKQLKDPADTTEHVMIEGQQHVKQDLLRDLLVETPGHAIAYLTDFLLDDSARNRLVPFVQGCDTVICESQYCGADLELARKNYHMVAAQAAELAHLAKAGELVLFHVSCRYDIAGWMELLGEAQSVFPQTRFPDHWAM